MKKRMVAIGISVVVLSALFAGCGTQSNNGNDAQTTVFGKNTGSAMAEENSATEESVFSAEKTTGKSGSVGILIGRNKDQESLIAERVM